MTPPQSDRDHWDARYAGGSVGRVVPFIAEIIESLPIVGRALDVAGGAGGTALALAEHGLDVTLAEVSAVALEIASVEADARDLDLECLQIDLTADPLPQGPWDVIVCANYLDRSLFPSMIEALAPGGLLAAVVATETNLERNDRPSRRFLVARGELRQLLAGLESVVDVEDWFDGRHEARFLGRGTRP